MGITAGDLGNIMVDKTGSATLRPFNLYVNSQNCFGSIRVGRTRPALDQRQLEAPYPVRLQRR